MAEERSTASTRPSPTPVNRRKSLAATDGVLCDGHHDNENQRGPKTRFSMPDRLQKAGRRLWRLREPKAEQELLQPIDPDRHGGEEHNAEQHLQR
jgi:hypothetical protein